ncbi:cilia- and flagella-associated protein 97 isoform X2 [Engraulis encrasicolus]|uniref:cilia- and flagella-associated protein 97 isoform X2 n=1 Tax=Engraulis encrasicolus TaxID=184585 RepID=UPI002FD5797B
MYSPKEQEEEPDHSFFDSDPEDEPSQDCDSKIQDHQDSLGNGVVSHGHRSPAELSDSNSIKQNHGGQNRMDDTPQVEGASIDLKEIKKAVSEVKDGSAENKRRGSPDLDSNDQTEKGECTVAESHENSESSEPLGANLVSRVSDEMQVNDASEGNKIKITNLDFNNGVKSQTNLKSNVDEEDDSSINLEDSSRERSLSRLSGSIGGEYPMESPFPCGQEGNLSETEVSESEDTVTDVTPLSTPDMSPAQSFDLPSFGLEAKQPTTKEGASPPPETAASCPNKEAKQHNVNITLSPRDNYHHEGHCRVRSAREQRSVGTGSAQSDAPSSQQRRNYTFRDDEVRRIDRENQRLLRELSRPSSRPRSANTNTNAAYSMSSSTSRLIPQTQRLYHSATNRQRDQKRIERENLVRRSRGCASFPPLP